MRFFRGILVIFLASIMILSCAKKLKEPEDVMEKMVEKYVKLVQKGIKSVDVKVIFNIDGGFPFFFGFMIGDTDAKGTLEFCATREPFRVYAKISGDFEGGEVDEIEVYVSEEDEKATIVYHDEEKYTEIDLDEDEMEEFLGGLEDGEEELKGKDISEKADDIVDEVFEESDIELADKLHKTKLGRAYKLTFRPPEDEDIDAGIDLYIAHGKWDPVRVEYEIEDSKGNIELEKLRINPRISGGKFKPKTKGYKEIDEDDMEELLEEIFK